MFKGIPLVCPTIAATVQPAPDNTLNPSLATLPPEKVRLLLARFVSSGIKLFSIAPPLAISS